MLDGARIDIDRDTAWVLASTFVIAAIAISVFYYASNKTKGAYSGAITYILINLLIMTFCLFAIEFKKHAWAYSVVALVMLALSDEILERVIIRRLDNPRRY